MNLLRRVSRLERESVFAPKRNPYEDLSDEELNRRITASMQFLFGDDTAARDAFMREALEEIDAIKKEGR